MSESKSDSTPDHTSDVPASIPDKITPSKDRSSKDTILDTPPKDTPSDENLSGGFLPYLEYIEDAPPKAPQTTPKMQSPSKLWYVSHLFLWLISGLVCYLIYHEKNPQAAKKHLIHSIWIPFAVFIPLFILAILSTQYDFMP